MLLADNVALITGGAGFLGSHTTRQLLDRGHDVVDRVADSLLAHVRSLRGSPLLDDDFSLIEARDLEQAAKIASGCPILEFGGCVEVRPVLQLGT